MIKINYHEVAYIPVEQASMLDSIERDLNNWATGEESICITTEQLQAELEEIQDKDTRLYLTEVIQTLKPTFGGDIIFHKA